MIKPITLNVTAQWFGDAKSGAKTEEYREVNDYWKKRLLNPDGSHKEFSHINYCLGYPKADDSERRLRFDWSGFEEKTIVHPHFNNEPKQVFAIKLTTSKRNNDE